MPAPDSWVESVTCQYSLTFDFRLYYTGYRISDAMNGIVYYEQGR